MTEKAETWGERKEGEGQNGQRLSQLGRLTPLRASLPTCDLWKPSPFSLSCSGDACFYTSLKTAMPRLDCPPWQLLAFWEELN